MALATMTTKGQLTLPKEIRQRLGLQPGDKVEITLDRSGGALLRPRQNSGIEHLFGMLPNKGVSLTVEEMHEATVDAVVEKHQRSLPKK